MMSLETRTKPLETELPTKSTSTTKHFDLHQVITDKIVNALENSTIPWKKPWNSETSFNNQNFHSGKRYNGMNQLLLGLSHYSTPYWMTFKQIKERGGKLKKGSKAEQIVFWKILDIKDKQTGDDKHIPFLRYSNVFNSEDIEDIDFPKPKAKPPIEKNEAAEKLIEMLMDMPKCPTLKHGGAAAYYSPNEDYVNMPKIGDFPALTGYADTLAHEFVHATKHKDRLNRTTDKNTSHNYHREELVAEIGNSFLCAEAGFDKEFDNQVAYIKNWMEAIKNDKNLIVWAASKATKAVDYILHRKESNGKTASKDNNDPTNQTTLTSS